MIKRVFEKKLFFQLMINIMVAFFLISPSVSSEEINLKEDFENICNLDSLSQENCNSKWKQITCDGFGKVTNLASRGMEIYNDELYIGTQNNKLPKLFLNTFPELLQIMSKLLPNKLPMFLQLNNRFKIIFRLAHFIRIKNMRRFLHIVTSRSEGCEIWKYNYTTDKLTQIVGENSKTGMGSGFGYNFNCMAGTMKVFKNKLYVGTASTSLGSLKNIYRKGAEIWRYDGILWEQVVGHNAQFSKGGFGNPENMAISDLKEFNGYLYAGTMNWEFTDKGGCEIWRTEDGIRWEQVVARGFKPYMSTYDLQAGATNTYLWKMEVFEDQLYAGTFNSEYKFLNNEGMGCQLWRTSDGKIWKKVQLPNGDGYGDKENYGIRTMVVYNDELYVGTASNIVHDKGFEIWKYDGLNWTPVISNDIEELRPNDIEYNGFGNPLNKYAWSMVVTSDNILWVGTANGKLVNLFEPKTEGCEIWCYNGIRWIPVVKDGNNEMQSGFGNIKNEGVRSMIEYPKGSGNIVVGTLKLTSTRPLIAQEGFELWMRTV